MHKRICTIFLCLALIWINGCGDRQQTAVEKSTASSPAATSDPVQSSTPSTETGNDKQPVSSEEIAAGKDYSWYYTPNQTHQVPRIPQEASRLLKDYNALYVVPDGGHHVYLTFDEGYELGNTGHILDILKDNQVKAAFFITGQFLKTQPQLVKRMKAEGHLVCNHTVNHKDLATLSRESINREITGLEQSVKDQTGVSMDKFLRPPMGNYSELSLAATHELGYTTVFWSMALVDWDPNKQPGVEAVYQHVIKNIHPGAIILLHAVSKSDTDALDRIIKELEREGYIFAPLKNQA